MPQIGIELVHHAGSGPLDGRAAAAVNPGMTRAVLGSAHRTLQHCRLLFRLGGASFIALGMLPLLGRLAHADLNVATGSTLSLLGCQLLGLSLTLDNALSGTGERGFLKATALSLLLLAGMRVAYLLADPAGGGAADLPQTAEILLLTSIALSFLHLRSRL